MEPFEADGVVYQLQLSRKSSTGYLCVVEERPGEFHAKGTFVKGGGQVFLHSAGRRVQDRTGCCSPPRQVQARSLPSRAHQACYQRREQGASPDSPALPSCAYAMRSLQAKRQKVVAQPEEESDEEHVPTEDQATLQVT